MVEFLFIEFVVLFSAWVGWSIGRDDGQRKAYKQLAAEADVKLLESVSRVGRLGERHE